MGDTSYGRYDMFTCCNVIHVILTILVISKGLLEPRCLEIVPSRLC